MGENPAQHNVCLIDVLYFGLGVAKPNSTGESDLQLNEFKCRLVNLEPH